MRSRPLITFYLFTAAPKDLGAGEHGMRVAWPIAGGSFGGERPHGERPLRGKTWAALTKFGHARTYRNRKRAASSRQCGWVRRLLEAGHV
jgi:hypothetical protein